jgi:excisionase family DNA binding protein
MTRNRTVTCPECGTDVAVPSEERIEPMYRLAEVEQALGVSRPTVKRWIYQGKLRAQKLGGGGTGSPWYVSESALTEFREQQGSR